MNIEQPITREDKLGCLKQTRTTHPAFAQIGAYRTSGHSHLYGSDFNHNATIRIRVYESELVRSLSEDRYHGKRPLMEVELSEAQWATFVSSLNVGHGVPCTLRYNGKDVPGLPPPSSRVDQFKMEAGKECQESLKLLNGLLAKIDDMKLTKAKTAELKGPIEAAIMALTDRLPFVAQQFSEHMEEVVEKAKQEVHGYVTGVIAKAGIAALAEVPLQLEDKEKP